jgi:AAA15 family ATPase/GTPase
MLSKKKIILSTSQQRIHHLDIKQLKCLNGVQISFEDKAVTAILGPNGHGKSTILHALACCYQPVDEKATSNYRFSDFFLPNTDAQWQGSELTLMHSYKNGADEIKNHPTIYKKSDRWTLYARRPKRHVYYLGIDKYIPIIESEKQRTKVQYTTETLSDNLTRELLDKASHIFNRTYTEYNQHTSSRGKIYIGVATDKTRYSSLSMSAGEQKVFLLLETIFKADKYSLILIDEIDLLLHNIALENLLKIIAKRAGDKKLQIVFTTHRESIVDLSEFLNIRHIVNKQGKTYCFNETKPDAIYRLTGRQEKTIEIFVEDNLAVAIVNKIVSGLGIKKHVSIKKFGAADNCFTTVAGILLSQENIDNCLFVLDGDVFITEQEKKGKLNKVITGHGDNIEKNREKALQHIKEFSLPSNIMPEKHLHNLLLTIDISSIEDEESKEILEIAKEISYDQDSHKYLLKIIEMLDYEKPIGYSKIIDLVSQQCCQWNEYVLEIFNWLKDKREEIREEEADKKQLNL